MIMPVWYPNRKLMRWCTLQAVSAKMLKDGFVKIIQLFSGRMETYFFVYSPGADSQKNRVELELSF